MPYTKAVILHPTCDEEAYAVIFDDLFEEDTILDLCRISYLITDSKAVSQKLHAAACAFALANGWLACDGPSVAIKLASFAAPARFEFEHIEPGDFFFENVFHEVFGELHGRSGGVVYEVCVGDAGFAIWTRTSRGQDVIGEGNLFEPPEMQNFAGRRVP